MMVLTVSSCPASLRGDLSKYLFEVQTGVYVGNPSRKIREKIWERVKQSLKNGRAVIVYSSNNEQGLKFDTIGSKWQPVNFDGLVLMKHPSSDEKDFDGNHIKHSAQKKTETKTMHLAKSETEKLDSEFIILDLETTGLNPETDRITEIGALKISNGSIVDSFQILVNSGKQIPEDVVKLNGITAEMLSQGIIESTALNMLFKFIDNRQIVGYNVEFDISFLNVACIRLDRPTLINQTLDLFKVVKREIKGLKNYKLITVLQYLGVSNVVPHRALKDCGLILKMLYKLNMV